MNNSLDLRDVLPLLAEVTESGGEFLIEPRGISMEPTLIQGRDKVALIKAKDIRPGDIVLYRRNNGQLVLHRMLKKRGDGYVMRGDNQLAKEYGVSDDCLLGLVCYMIRRGKKIKRESLKFRLLGRIAYPKLFVKRGILKILRILGIKKQVK